MAFDEPKDSDQEQDVEGHKLSREVWSREGADDEDDVEGHKLSRE
jgi:hypothetical protein